MPPTARVTVEIYEGKPSASRRPQTWRWRALNANNHRKMAASTEAYTNKADCFTAVAQLFGPATTIHLTQPDQPDLLLRTATTDPTSA